MENVNLTYSCILHKNNKKIVRVTFERKGATGLSYAEGIVPDGIIEKQKGFTETEVEQLSAYLRNHSDEIFAQAKKISNIAHWLK